MTDFQTEAQMLYVLTLFALAALFYIIWRGGNGPKGA